MKVTKHNLPTILLGTITLMALTACSAPPAKGAQTNEASSAKVASMFNHNKEITGKVTAKSASGITVGSTMVAVTDSTSFLKSGQTISLDDIQVGDQVKVVATPGPGGKLTAVSIQVVSRNSGAG